MECDFAIALPLNRKDLDYKTDELEHISAS
jgi:hypothetical protein